MKFRIALPIFLVFVTCCAGAGGSDAVGPAPEALPQFVNELRAGIPKIIVTYGTSLTAPNPGPWVPALKEKLESEFPGLATVYNEGMPGSDSNYGVSHIVNVLRHNPDVVFIEFSMNDVLFMPVALANENLEIMVSTIQKVCPGCEIIIETMNPSTYPGRVNLPLYYQGYRDFAKANNLPLMDHYANWMAFCLDDPATLVPEYITDGIHPNTLGTDTITVPGLFSFLAL